jgi:serine/threonine-protein kinase PpkA
MASILLVDDDVMILETTELLLAGAGHSVRTAPDGLRGLTLALESVPDLVLLDIRMPVLDGFGLMAALRANQTTRRVQCVMMTALDDRESLRKAMSYGADGMLLKPVGADALLETIARRLAIAPDGPKPRPPGVAIPSSGWPAQAAPRAESPIPAGIDEALTQSSTRAMFRETRRMTVLFSDVRNFSRLSEMLPSSEVADMLQGYYQRAAQIVRRQNGLVIRIIGDALLAAFESPEADEEHHAERAIRCGLLLQATAAEFASGLAQRYKDRSLPPFAVGVGIHTGEVMVCSMGPGRTSEVTVIGDTVNVAAHLDARSKEMGCVVLASAATSALAEASFVRGRTERIQLKGRLAEIDTVEILGFTPRGRTEEKVVALRANA